MLLGTERKEQAVLHSHLSQLDLELSGGYLPGQMWGRIFCAEGENRDKGKEGKESGKL